MSLDLSAPPAAPVALPAAPAAPPAALPVAQPAVGPIAPPAAPAAFVPRPPHVPAHAARGAHAAPAARAHAVDPPSRPAARHRRRRDLPELAERLWRPPLALAVAIFAACGPAHALGHPDLVFNAVLVALALSSVSVPLGLFALRHVPDA